MASNLKENVNLASFTTYRIGGKAKYFFESENKEGLIEAVKKAKENKIPFFVLGGGSNVLVSDKGFKGLVIKIGNCGFKFDNSEVFAEAGISLSKLVNNSAQKGLSGLEWAAGIHGTLGGAVRGNAGAFGKEIKDAIKEVEVFDCKKEKIKVFKNKDCFFKYRDSVFKKDENLIILSAVLKLYKGKRNKIKEKIKKYLDYRKKNHPLDFPSAGSVFKNPVSYPAGKMIGACGLAGKVSGRAQISAKHSNFIINLGGAKAKDITSLIKLAKKQVKEKFKIELEEEIKYLGF